MTPEAFDLLSRASHVVVERDNPWWDMHTWNPCAANFPAFAWAISCETLTVSFQALLRETLSDLHGRPADPILSPGSEQLPSLELFVSSHAGAPADPPGAPAPTAPSPHPGSTPPPVPAPISGAGNPSFTAKEA